MDDIKAKLSEAVKQAMINKDSARRDVVRGLLSAIKQVEIDTRKELSPEDILAIVQREAKKRRESIEEANKLGRAEIAEEEKSELAIIESFLPQQLSREAIIEIVKETLSQTGITSPSEMGKLMGALMPKVKGLADGKLVNEIVKELLK
jgi:uncharacterized protein YqeY